MSELQIDADREPRPAQARIRLDYLDGLRALCALAVLAAHALDGGFFDQTTPRPFLLEWAAPLAPYGRYAVTFFIVLSGYCLMLPVARTPEGTLSGGFRGYIFRRARRMLPPYYAALSFALLALWATRQVFPSPITLREYQQAIEPGALLSHLFMAHNLRADWAFKIDAPMWSVATEWDIYFLFPFLLLPLWRRIGIMLTISLAYVLSMMPHFLLNKWLDPVAPWYLALFAMGMAGALISYSERERYRSLRQRLPWGALTALGTALLILVFALKPAHLPSYPLYLTEPVFGLVAICLLIYCTRYVMGEAGDRRPLVLKILEFGPLVAIGFYSYSLYLMHAPLLHIGLAALNATGRTPMQKWLLLWTIAVPMTLLFSYLFHRVFERPFMAHYPRKRTQTAP
jgi:peptidoglycan/LPS O-acetylase OafA/YrhL